MFYWVPHAVVFSNPHAFTKKHLECFILKTNHNKNRVQNKNQLNKSPHMFFIFLYSVKEVNVA